ncbi:transporter substrate-binding domain-containing protein [Castellaniella sp.]|uniref:transporter substrate-binding domain-containing protein n=1 Tax=Castellaniella sp. TaxID=1955812 RepID=UPI00356090C0
MRIFSSGGRWQWLATLTAVAASTLAMGAVSVAHADGLATVESGTLTVGSDLTYPPYAYFTDKVPSGFDPDFSRLMAKYLDLQVNILDTRFADLILGLRANRFDIVASALYVTPERAKIINYVPYSKTGASFIVLKNGDVRPETPEQLCGLKVSSIKAASWIPALRAVSKDYCPTVGKGPIQVLEFPTAPEGLLALRSKGVDVMIDDAAVSHRMVSDMNDIEISSKSLLYPIVIALGVSKSQTALLEALNDALDRAKKDGTYQALLERYGLEAPTAEEIQASLAEKPGS